ncbi:Crp/Fnr family transcriptional regulator [Pedobacter steynii]|uniref:Crp/Fnr family transcriptional regulator n=1 Tax=Pedobacter steynii TaxID=430522 RepID=A0A1D7QKI9_9SPHI|nr:Crp/Fnr family transcriptional regulator [Pedobacter steynii]AOM79186.1 Crp/Fnr family transcriptional regulator [Pedobacter steynii]
MLLLTEIEKVIPISKEMDVATRKKFVKRKVFKTESLHETGKIARELFFIEEGLIRIFYHNDSGKDITYGFYTEGDFVTVPESFYTQSASKYHMETLEEGLIYAISYTELNLLLHDFPEMQRFENKTLQSFLLKASERIVALQFLSAEERYDTLMETQPSIIRRAPLGTIASYLGITQETLSRIRNKKKSLFDLDQKRIA